MRRRIPAELRSLAQWVCCRPDKIPLNPCTGQRASVTDRATWGTFEQALASQLWTGFVLNSDPYTVIDLDDKGSNTREQQDVHARILSAFSDTYVERSINGRGYHIWCKGSLPEAIKRDSVEIYACGRYMICTGDVANDKPIVDKQALLLQLAGEMKLRPTAAFADSAPALEDAEIWRMASTAANADKFIGLCEGQWSVMGYPSQSEADEALLSILAFYSKNNEQCTRMFRQTRLGERKKAQRDDYLVRSLKRVRSTEIAPVDLSMLASPVNPATIEGKAKSFTRPPGLVGDIADYIYSSAPHPVTEVALAAALALVSGIAGRTYNISSTGLNQYLVVLAESGVGKEAAESGITRLLAAVGRMVPAAVNDGGFKGPGEFASGQGLVRTLDTQPCFVSVIDEFGTFAERICRSSASSSDVALRKTLLSLYNKSGAKQILAGTSFADKDKNTKYVQSPAVTLLGLSTPETFFDSLSTAHISTGLIPRFTVLEYTGQCAPLNKCHSQPPRQELVDRLVALTASVLAKSNNGACETIAINDDAEKLLDAFQAKATDKRNEASKDVAHRLWSRAYVKALKFAGVLAVGENCNFPRVTIEHAAWAIDLAERDVISMLDHFASGSVGLGDHRLDHDVRQAFVTYCAMPIAKRKSYKVPEILWSAPVAPLNYFVRKLQGTASFQQDRRGATKAINDTLASLVAQGVLQLIAPQQVAQQYRLKTALYCAGDAL